MTHLELFSREQKESKGKEITRFMSNTRIRQIKTTENESGQHEFSCAIFIRKSILDKFENKNSYPLKFTVVKSLLINNTSNEQYNKFLTTLFKYLTEKAQGSTTQNPAIFLRKLHCLEQFYANINTANVSSDDFLRHLHTLHKALITVDSCLACGTTIGGGELGLLVHKMLLCIDKDYSDTYNYEADKYVREQVSATY